LIDMGYSGVAAVELPRHGHAAPEVARRSFDALRAARWLAHAERTVRDDPGSVQRYFSAAGRETRFGADDARIRLVVACAEASPDVVEGLTALYRRGSSAERRAVLHALAEVGGKAPDAGLVLVKDALRTNETGLVTAALGAFAGKHLDQHSWRHGVLKCLFMGIPLDVVAGLEQRTDAELLRMVAAFADERRAAGRPVPDDALTTLGKAS
jgi:hypothetical protein